MIRHLLMLLGLISLLQFAACSGGGEDSPQMPQSLLQRFPQADMQNLMVKADQMVQTCTSGLSSPALMLATGMMGTGGASNLGAMLPMLMSQSGAGRDQCGDSLLQFVLLANTARTKDGTCFSNDPEGAKYRNGQILRVVTGLWGSILQGFQSNGTPLTQQQMVTLQQTMLAAGPTIITSLVSSSGAKAGQLGGIASGFGL